MGLSLQPVAEPAVVQLVGNWLMQLSPVGVPVVPHDVRVVHPLALASAGKNVVGKPGIAPGLVAKSGLPFELSSSG